MEARLYLLVEYEDGVQLIQDTLSGDDAAFNTLVQKCYPRLFKEQKLKEHLCACVSEGHFIGGSSRDKFTLIFFCLFY